MEFIIGGVILLTVFLLPLAMAGLCKRGLWLVAPLFAFLNRLQWFLYNPLRFLMKSGRFGFARCVYVVLLYGQIIPLYWLTIHLALTPLRVITAFYYDVALYWAVMLDDVTLELLAPKLGEYRQRSGWRYTAKWFLGFPTRFETFLSKSLLTVADSVLMMGVSTVFPTFTMYHGTTFKGPASDIVQQGRWYVGSGTHAGSGIYFAVQKRVAHHYADGGKNRGIVIVRFTPTFTRNQTTFPKKVRDLIGVDGKKLSRQIQFPWATIEHWREDLNGWEYCFAQPGKSRKFIRSWRIRPIAVLGANDRCPVRIWGGMENYCSNSVGLVVGVLSWGIIAGGVWMSLSIFEF